VGDSWLEQCINFEAMFAAHLMPYTVQPNVMIGRVDLAAVFLHRESLLADKIQFGKTRSSCLPSLLELCALLW
jgi:hypothetical protein